MTWYHRDSLISPLCDALAAAPADRYWSRNSTLPPVGGIIYSCCVGGPRARFGVLDSSKLFVRSALVEREGRNLTGPLHIREDVRP